MEEKLTRKGVSYIVDKYIQIAKENHQDVDIKTTEIYARIDGEMKRKALEKGTNLIPNNDLPIWQENKSLLEWLNSLG